MATTNFLWRRRNYDWIILLFLSFVYANSSIREWTSQESFPWDSPSMVTFFVPIMFIIIFGMLFQRYALKRTWEQVFRFTGPLEPKDEREWVIHGRATEYTFGLVYLLLFFLASLFLVLPNPSSVALFYALLSFLFFVVALRGFFTWLFGIR